MDSHLKIVRQSVVLIVIFVILGLFDWLGYLAPITRLSDWLINPVQVRVEGVKNDVRLSWSRILGKDDVSSELQVMKQLVRGEVEQAAELNRLRSENQAFRKLMEIHTERMELKTAYVLAVVDDGVFIDVGREHGIEDGMVVMVDGILWGQVISVEGQKSKVKILNDDKAEWRVSVLNDKGESVEGLLGSKDGVLEIRGILVSDNVKIGDSVVSVGGDGLLANLPIGKILSLSVVDETALYQFAQVAWPIDSDYVKQVAVIIKW